jgi:hypothetical protein
VLGKGEIDIALSGVGTCLAGDAVRAAPQAFTMTGGTGIYASASGSGTLQYTINRVSGAGRAGTDLWIGTLLVPGLAFERGLF